MKYLYSLLCILFIGSNSELTAYITSYNVKHEQDNPIVSVANSEGVAWHDNVVYLTYLLQDESGQFIFRTYPFSSINTAGYYRLADNVSNTITITVGNVTLDMNGCSIAGVTNGIVINSGLDNVTIKNGMVSNATGDGIQINSGCTNILLDHLSINNATHGIIGTNVTNGIMRSCDVIGSNTGVQLTSCCNIVLENCTAQTNIYAGFSLVTSTTCTLFDCKALSTGQGNTNLVGNIYGFVSNAGYGNIFERCVANSTQGLTLTSFNSIIAGFALLGTSTQCHKIVDCEAGNSTTNPNQSAVAIPYGIYLQGTLNSSLAVTTQSNTTDAIVGVDAAWSPDGAYVGVAGLQNGSGLAVCSFSRTLNTLTTVVSFLFGANPLSIDWYPGDGFIAIGAQGGNVYLLTFDRLNNVLRLYQTVSGLSGEIRQVKWSPNGQFLAVATDGGGNTNNIYYFDSITQKLTFAVAVSYGTPTGAVARGVSWSSDGKYLAYIGQGNGASANQLEVFQISQTGTSASASLVAQATISGVSDGTAVMFSPDDNYIAVIVIGTSNTRIFKFNGTSLVQTSAQDTNTPDLFGDGKINWSADMQYVVTAYQKNGGGGVVALYSFDEGTGLLTSINSNSSWSSFFNSGVVNGCRWSPDGGYIAIAGDGSSSHHALILINGISFPSGNVIMNNKLYCNSGNQYAKGVGISGSSIVNTIIGNTAYNNPVFSSTNQANIPSNYVFVTNVFNQLFGLAPTALQNIQVSGGVPLWQLLNFPLQLQRVNILAQSLVDHFI